MVSTSDTPISSDPDLLATDSTSKDQSLTTIKEYGNTLTSLISNSIPSKIFCANGIDLIITPLNEGTDK